MARIPLSDVPAAGTKVIEIDDRKVLLCRSVAGIHAIDPICPHQTLTLDGGRVRGMSIICPHHGARFSLEDGRSMSPLTTKPLTLYATKQEDDQLDIALQPLKPAAGHAPRPSGSSAG